MIDSSLCSLSPVHNRSIYKKNSWMFRFHIHDYKNSRNQLFVGQKSKFVKQSSLHTMPCDTRKTLHETDINRWMDQKYVKYTAKIMYSNQLHSGYHALKRAVTNQTKIKSLLHVD